jgi:hypothetical protein
MPLRPARAKRLGVEVDLVAIGDRPRIGELAHRKVGVEAQGDQRGELGRLI